MGWLAASFPRFKHFDTAISIIGSDEYFIIGVKLFVLFLGRCMIVPANFIIVNMNLRFTSTSGFAKTSPLKLSSPSPEVEGPSVDYLQAAGLQQSDFLANPRDRFTLRKSFLSFSGVQVTAACS